MFAFRSRLFWKAFASLALGLLVWLPVFYWLTVPLINRQAYEIEEKAARIVLDDVVQLVGESHRDLAAWRQSALDAHRRELKSVLQLVETWVGHEEAKVAAGRLSREQVRRELLESLRRVRYGSKGYLWVADYNAVLVSHPDRDFNNRDASAFRDSGGNLVIPAMVREARKSGEGYFSYRWRRPDTGIESEKLSYFRNFAAWQLVIGTGVYNDDIEQETARRKEAMVAQLRQYLHGVKVAGSGYVFVFDGSKRLLVHPDSRIEGGSLAGIIEPASGRPIGDQFVEAAGRPDQTLSYRWNRPDDPDNYRYRKVAWIHHVPEYDWYLGATAYVDELERSGDRLSTRIVVAFLIGLSITALLVLFFIRSVTAPILRLADTARRAIAGDLSAASDIERSDEIGVLANAFNNMVAQLKGQIETLEQRVAERTRELAGAAARLESQVAARTAEARASEARFRGLVEQSLAGILVIQGEVVRYINPGFARMHGYADPAEMLGIAPMQLVAPEDRPQVRELGRRLLAGESEGVTFEMAGLRRDGSRVDCEAHACRIEYDGKPALILLALDITERKQAEAAREAALAAAEHLSRLKSEFMANMSHELRTPLNAVIGLAHIGHKTADLPKAQEICGRILVAGQHLLQLVGDVLDFSRVEAGQFQFQPADFDLVQLVEDVAAQSEVHAHGKGIDFQLAVELGDLRRYRGDSRCLARVLDILLANAVKFTDHGSVALRLARDDDKLLFRIADTGIGMTPQQVERLFRPFEQIDGSATRRHGGIGLGLALAERLTVLMGGSIRVDSQVGAGSTFEVRLPLASGQSPAETPQITGDFSI